MAAPIATSATISANGTTLTVVWSEASTNVATPTVVIAGRLATLTSTYASGTTTTTLVYTIASAVYQSETATLSGAAGMVTATVGDTPNAAFSGQAITNNSTQTVATVCDGAAAGMLVNRCMILRKTTTTDSGSGATGNTWAPVYYPVCCNIQMGSSTENFEGQQESPGFSFSGYFPASLALRHSDRVCNVTGAGVKGLSGKVLEVVGAPSDHAGRGAYLFAPLSEVPGNGG